MSILDKILEFGVASDGITFHPGWSNHTPRGLKAVVASRCKDLSYGLPRYFRIQEKFIHLT